MHLKKNGRLPSNETITSVTEKYKSNNWLGIINACVSLEIIENQDLFDDNEWEELYKLSEETFVEESEALKQSAAGAGLTDND